MKQVDINQLNETHESSSLATVCSYLNKTFKQDIILASSLGAEDQVLTHALLTENPKARIFVLDTGRLNQETYDVMQRSRKKYAINYEVYYPDTHKIESLIRKEKNIVK